MVCRPNTSWTDKDTPLQLKELDVVRVIGLERSGREFTGTETVARAPRVGDEGTIVYSSGVDGAPFTVEMVDDDGLTVWVADFALSELELLWAYPDGD